jgi:hypothetical protein
MKFSIFGKLLANCAQNCSNKKTLYKYALNLSYVSTSEMAFSIFSERSKSQHFNLHFSDTFFILQQMGYVTPSTQNPISHGDGPISPTPF